MSSPTRVYPLNPIEEKDGQIAILEKNIENLQAKEAENIKLKESLSKLNADLSWSLKKLEFTKKATEQRLVDNITNTEGFRADPVLIGVYSATLDESEIDFEEPNGVEVEARSRKDIFLAMKEKLDPENSEQNERFIEVTNQILEKVKATKHSRNRSVSSHSTSSRTASGKRNRSKDDLKDSDRDSARQRTSGIPTKQ